MVDDLEKSDFGARASKPSLTRLSALGSAGSGGPALRAQPRPQARALAARSGGDWTRAGGAGKARGMSSPLLRWLAFEPLRLTIDDVRAALRAGGFDGTVRSDTDTMAVFTRAGVPVLDIDVVVKGDADGLFAEELAEFDDRLEDARPAANADRLRTRLPEVRTLIALAPYWAEDGEAAAEAADAVLTAVRARTDGLLHVLDEGFSTRGGDLVVWELPDEVDGEWRVALVREGGSDWEAFTLDVENAEARAAFLEGRRR